MLTDLIKANIHARKVMSEANLKDQFLNYLDFGIRRIIKTMTTGLTPSDDAGGWFKRVHATDGTGSTVTFTALYGVDGKGDQISAEAGESRITNVPFQNTLGVTYYMGVTVAQVPTGISQDSVSGAPYYNAYEDEIGHSADPSLVTSASSTIQFTLANHVGAGDNLTGRTAYAFLKSPVSNEEGIAIQSGTISGNTLTVGRMGQSTITTVAANYTVIVMGPRITRTNIYASPGVAFIGTVVGAAAPRTYVTTLQRFLGTLASVSLSVNSLVDRGWITYPTVTVGASTITVQGDGVPYVSGAVWSAATSGPLSFGASAESWVYWDPSIGNYVVTATRATAFASGVLPLLYVKSDGSSNVTFAAKAYGIVAGFNRQLTFTVTSDTTNYPGAFQTLPDALAAARSAYLLAGAGQSPAITIEVIGYVNVAASITLAELFATPNVTIVGRSSSLGISGVNDDVNAKIRWNHAGSLFGVGTGTMKGWMFKNIHFQCDNVGTAATDSMIASTGTIESLTFEDCVFDGVNLHNTGSGRFAHVLYVTGGTCTNVTFRRCNIFLADAVMFQTAGTMDALTVDSCNILDNNATSLTATARGGFYCSGSGGCNNVNVFNTNYVGQDSFLRSAPYNGSNVYIRDSRFTGTTTGVDRPFIDLSGASGPAFLIGIHDCYFRQASTGTPASAMIDLNVNDEEIAAALSSAGIHVHNCHFRSESDAAGIGVRIANYTSSFGVHIVDNDMGLVKNGIRIDDTVRGVVISGNAIASGEHCIYVDSIQDSVITGNVVRESGSSPGIYVGVTAVRVVVANNVITEPAGGGTSDLSVLCTLGAIVTGNIVRDQLNVDIFQVVTGNYADRVVGGSGSGITILTGNYLTDPSGVSIDINAQRAIIIGNFAGSTIDMSADFHLYVGNAYTWGTTQSAQGLVVVGNAANVSGTESFSGVANVIVGNNGYGGTMQVGSSTVVVGNNLGPLSLLSAASDVVLSGNRITTLVQSSASAQLAISGNYIDGAVSLNGDRGTFCSNYCNSTVLFDTQASEWAIGINRLDSTFTNNSTGSTVTGNDS